MIDSVTPLKDLSCPPPRPYLLSKSYLRVFKAMSGFH